MQLAIIVAVADNGVIGRDNALPWRIPADMRHFKQMTMGKPVIMGRKTYESIGKPLPGRVNVVITRNAAFAATGVHCVSSLHAALQVAREASLADEAVVIGGSAIYQSALPLADRLYITEVHAHVTGDALLPAVAWDDWQEVGRERHTATASEALDYSFVFYQRVRS